MKRISLIIASSLMFISANVYAQNEAELADNAVKEIAAEETVKDPKDNEDNYLYHVRDRAYEISLSYPFSIMEYPELHLLVAEERKNLEGFAKDSEKDFEELKEVHFGRYNYSVDFSVVAQNDQLVSMRQDIYMYMGGAHGIYGASPLLWDVPKKQKIEKTVSIFKDNMAFLHGEYCKKLSVKKAEMAISYGEKVEAKNMESYDNGFGCPTFDDLTILLQAKTGDKINVINIIANPYVAGPYSDGQYEIEIKVDGAVKAMIKPEYIPAFQ